VRNEDGFEGAVEVGGAGGVAVVVVFLVIVSVLVGSAIGVVL
jgi:hypothetical protein